MTVLERIENLRQTWTALLPHIPAPSPEDIARWCNYPHSAVEQAIMRTAKRFSASRVDAANLDAFAAYRYTTGTARSIAGIERN